MFFKEISEQSAIHFTNKLLNAYKKIDNGSMDTILTSQDFESFRNNAGWYQHVSNQHKIFINIPNILCTKFAVERGIIDSDVFYALLTLCTGHEFRHFLQGRVIYEGQEMDGYNQEDALNLDLMLYIRFFFDAYYQLNKGNMKYELDAEKFAIINGINYLKENYPSMDAEKSMLEAINYYANIQSGGGINSTLPLGCNTLDEVIQELQNRIKNNERIPVLNRTLFVSNPRFYKNHLSFGLEEEKVITKGLLQEYYDEKDGSKRDLLVVKRIITLLEHPEESLGDFSQLKKRYKEKSL